MKISENAFYLILILGPMVLLFLFAVVCVLSGHVDLLKEMFSQGR